MYTIKKYLSIVVLLSIYIICIIIQHNIGTANDTLFTILGTLTTLLLIGISFLLFKKIDELTSIHNKDKTGIYFPIAWYCVYAALIYVTKLHDFDLVNEFTHWIFIVILPILCLKKINHCSLKEVLSDIGFKRHGLKKIFLNAIIICLIMTPIYILILAWYYNIQWGEISNDSLNIIMNIALFFPIMILTAGFTEEVFFRGILQNSFHKHLNSNITSVILASLLFGIYHFPFAYLLWEGTNGSFLASASAILTEQAISGILFGVLYFRSKNIWLPIIIHSYSNALIMAFSNLFL